MTPGLQNKQEVLSTSSDLMLLFLYERACTVRSCHWFPLFPKCPMAPQGAVDAHGNLPCWTWHYSIRVKYHLTSVTSMLILTWTNLTGVAFVPPVHGKKTYILFLSLAIQTFQRKSLGVSKPITEESHWVALDLYKRAPLWNALYVLNILRLVIIITTFIRICS